MREFTRREWLSMTVAHSVAWAALPAESTRDARIRAIIDAFEKQGFHRTATDVDRASADWLCREVEQAGLTPARESFSIDRVDLVDIAVVARGRRIDGVPLFDGVFTDAAGIGGRLGALDSGDAIGLTQIAPNAAGAGPQLRSPRQPASRHRARNPRRPARAVPEQRGRVRAAIRPAGRAGVQRGVRVSRRVREAGTEVLVHAHVKRTASRALNVVTKSPARTGRFRRLSS